MRTLSEGKWSWTRECKRCTRSICRLLKWLRRWEARNLKSWVACLMKASTKTLKGFKETFCYWSYTLPGMEKINYWNFRESVDAERSKSGPESEFTPREKLFICLVHLETGIELEDSLCTFVLPDRNIEQPLVCMSRTNPEYMYFLPFFIALCDVLLPCLMWPSLSSWSLRLKFWTDYSAQ